MFIDYFIIQALIISPFVLPVFADPFEVLVGGDDIRDVEVVVSIWIRIVIVVGAKGL